MSLLQPSTNQPGFLKGGFLGFAKSGKTWTAISLAIGTRKFFELDGPIAMFDTEDGSGYVAQRVKEETGKELMVFKGRALDRLMDVARECVEQGISVLVVDSITHVWREIQSAYAKKTRQNLSLMAIHHIMKIKEIWAAWPDFFLTAPLHIIVCGRAGFEWAHEENPETHKKELVKGGTKMKVETEFGFEASLLVEMERINPVRVSGSPAPKLSRQATVIGDRFGVIDGKTCENPKFEFFLPHIQLLKPNGHTPVDVGVHSEPDIDEEGDAGWRRERKLRVIFCEEIQGALVTKFPSLKAEDKAAKAALIYGMFGTRSWTAVEGMHSGSLQEGLKALRAILKDEEELGYFIQRASEVEPGELLDWHFNNQAVQNVMKAEAARVEAQAADEPPTTPDPKPPAPLTEEQFVAAVTDVNLDRREKIVMAVTNLVKKDFGEFTEAELNRESEIQVKKWLKDRDLDFRSIKSQGTWLLLLSERQAIAETLRQELTEIEDRVTF